MSSLLNDPMLLIVLVLIIGFLLALYLVFRRTMLAFQEGANNDRR
ncbi:DUF7859 family protein [Halocatena halophila]